MEPETADHSGSSSFSTSAASGGKKVSRESEAECKISGDLHPSLHTSIWDRSCVHGWFHKKYQHRLDSEWHNFLGILLQASSFSPDDNKNKKRSRTLDITNWNT